MMFERFSRFAFVAIAPFFLFGCILTPGKFTSGLSINKDRTFTFTYKGEVIAIDPSEEFSKGLKSRGQDSDEDAEPAKDEKKSTFAEADAKKDEVTTSDDPELKRRAIAEALKKEAGYKSVQYMGKGKYVIDYAISGVLNHSFIYPYNQDAEIIFPFITLEVRAGNTVRMRAPGYADSSKSQNKSGMGSAGGDASKFLDGEFTLDTDAEIISQNNEDGATKVKGRSIIKWRATPVTKDAPSAVLRFVG
jgi:hypothetical protein